MKYIFWLIWIVCFFIMLLYYGKRKHPILSAMLSMFCGVTTLIVCHLFGHSIGFTPQINFFNTMLSLTLGIPSIVLIYIST
ncbi:MAG: pro-sigmaK processing inhibitor BofA family protein, partial [Ruminococcus sp.]|nr:pro-sigmaK processing inhibitor BofA family protein [Ruminococcus sp.]